MNQRRKIPRPFPARRPDTGASSAGVGELFEILLQVSFAVMLIFMLAFILFMDKVGTELDQLDRLQSELSEARIDKLAAALERTEQYYRARYRLDFFVLRDPVTGTVEYPLRTVVNGGRFTDDQVLKSAYVEGIGGGRDDYADLAGLLSAWRARGCESAGIAPADLSADEARFLDREVASRVAALRAELGGVQRMAALSLQNFYLARPESIDDSEVRGLISAANSAADGAARTALSEELGRKLRDYIFRELHRVTGVALPDNAGEGTQK